ncbi:MAG: tetratricopeptide repeat protein [Cyanobacteria bacterium P01_F01_bin.150]
MFYVWLKRLSSAPLFVALSFLGLMIPMILNGGEAVSATQRQANAQAIASAAQSAEMTPEEKLAEGDRLFDESLQFWRTSQWQKALDRLEQALVLYQDMNVRAAFPWESRQGEGRTLNGLGKIADDFGDYPEALDYYQQALEIRREIGDRAGEGVTLNNIGGIYDNLSDYPKALDYYQQALGIRREIGDRVGEGRTLNNIGGTYDNLGDYPKALDYYQQALGIRREIGDRAGEGDTLNNIGGTYDNLGDYPEALDYYQQALGISREIGDRVGEGRTLNNIGLIYDNLGDYPEALDYYQQALGISREIGDRATEGRTLNNIGLIYDNLGDYPEALNYYQQALGISREIGDRATEGRTLNNIGLIYDNLGDYPEALDYYQQALGISREIGDRAGEGGTLNNIGRLLDQTNQPELAIIFLKQSVSTYEKIRQTNKQLSQELQQSYTDTIADTYRKLADLLLQENRILEAQQILDLLKIQELNDFLHNVRGTPDSQITILRPEIAILEKYQELQQSIILLTQEQAAIYTRIRETGDITPADQERLGQIDAILSDLSTQFQAFIDDPDVQKQIAALDIDVQEQTIPLERLTQLQDNLADLNAVMLYPLVLDDRIELIITTPTSAPIQRTVQGVSRTQLNDAITTFRLALDDPGSDAITPAQKLYDWLIAPIESDLTAAGLDTIIYAPDGPLRYIPLAALHDGDQWLAERFRINHITAASIDDLSRPDRTQPVVLAGAFSDPSVSHDVTVGDRTLPFNGLPYAGEEVKSLENNLPNISAHFDDSFDLESLKPSIGAYNILHFATHAAFLPDYPVNSFILSGNGNTVSLQSLRERWNFSGIDLVVLSACETGLGGYDNNGEQILGLGYVFQEKGAKAVMASLWQVSDRGTQTLMDAFYAALNNGYGKSEALQRAQQALISGDQTVLENSGHHPQGERGATLDIIDSHTGRSLTHGSTLNHPYYWAPFILIGNGL